LFPIIMGTSSRLTPRLCFPFLVLHLD